MKGWAALIVVLFAVMLALLLAPLAIAAFGWDVQVRDIYGVPWVWAWGAVMVVGEALLLFVPVAIGERRPRARRRLMDSVVVSAFFMALLGIAAVISVFMAMFGDGKSGPFPSPDLWPSPFNRWEGLLSAALLVTLALWCFWGFLFYQFRKADEDGLIGRLMKWLLGGSILELLVAVPSHVIVRQRNDCCAPVGTFFGMGTGLAVMLMTFGPGVLWLYARRMERLRGDVKTCTNCGYDLRATPDRCPECGQVVRKITAATKPGGE